MWNLKRSFRAVPQSKFKDIDTIIQADTFENDIESFPDSERDMFRNVEIIVKIEPSTLVDILMMKMHLECNTHPCTPAASDSSVICSSGTYGWKISLKDDTRIVSCRGKAYGFPMTSHRAEAYGMWSILLFIIRLFEFRYQNPSNVLTLVCDNRSIVNTANKIVDNGSRFQMKH